MKKSIKILLTIAILGSAINESKAQIDFGTFLEAGVGDANQLLESYFEPAFVGFGFGMNSGWYNTAKPHKFLGFDLSISASAAIVPDAKQFFTFNNSDYENVFFSDGSSVELPTLFGPNLGADDLPQLTFRDILDVDNDGDFREELIRISAPTGLGIDTDFPVNAVPTPMIQLGIGLFKGTEVKLRIIPETLTQSLFGDDDEFGLKVFGIGVMHDIKQWLPASKLLPFDLSLFVGYTNLNATMKLDPDDPTSDQVARFDASAVTAQAVISKKLALFTAFAGLGWAKSDVDFTLEGRYETESSVLVDPIAFNFSNSGLRANVGLRIKLLFLTLTGEYAIQEYNTITGTVGFSFR